MTLFSGYVYRKLTHSLLSPLRQEEQGSENVTIIHPTFEKQSSTMFWKRQFLVISSTHMTLFDSSASGRFITWQLQVPSIVSIMNTKARISDTVPTYLPPAPSSSSHRKSLNTSVSRNLNRDSIATNFTAVSSSSSAYRDEKGRKEEEELVRLNNSLVDFVFAGVKNHEESVWALDFLVKSRSVKEGIRKKGKDISDSLVDVMSLEIASETRDGTEALEKALETLRVSLSRVSQYGEGKEVEGVTDIGYVPRSLALKPRPDSNVRSVTSMDAPDPIPNHLFRDSRSEFTRSVFSSFTRKSTTSTIFQTQPSLPRSDSHEEVQKPTSWRQSGSYTSSRGSFSESRDPKVRAFERYVQTAMESMDKAVSELLAPDHPQSVDITLKWAQKEIAVVVREAETRMESDAKVMKHVKALRVLSGKLEREEDCVGVLEDCFDVLSLMHSHLKQL